MIGKQIKGKSFASSLAYVLGKTQATVIDANVVGTTPAQLAQQFEFCCASNPAVKRVLYHAILSATINESSSVSLSTWSAIASDYLSGMGFTNVPYLVVLHEDRPHSHVHIIAGRVRSDGSCVSDRWDYNRSQKLIRSLERKYGLSSPTMYDYQPKPGEEKAYSTIKDAIDISVQGANSLKELLAGLLANDLELKLKGDSCKPFKVRGIRYSWGGFSFTGTQLGAAYTWRGIRERKPVYADKETTLSEYDDFLDQVKTQLQQQRFAQILPLGEKILKRLGKSVYCGRRYRLSLSNNLFKVDRLEDDSIVFAAQKENNCWISTCSSAIKNQDLDKFKLFLSSLNEEFKKDYESLNSISSTVRRSRR